MVLEEPMSDDVVVEINEIQVSFEKMAHNFTEDLTLDNQNGQFILLNSSSHC
jgi:Fe-S cluster assembly iron-binding protein IscA